jgi:hypothetical protein
VSGKSREEEARAHLLDSITSGNYTGDGGDDDVGCGFRHIGVVVSSEIVRGFGDESDGDLMGNSCTCSFLPLCPRFTAILPE